MVFEASSTVLLHGTTRFSAFHKMKFKIFSSNFHIRHFHISHNAPYCPPPPPQILHNLCFSFLLGITAVLREIEINAYAKF